MSARVLGLAVAALCCAGAVAQTEDVDAVLDAAFSHCEEATAAYEERDPPLTIASECPELLDAVAGSGRAALLPKDWDDTLTQQRLSDLQYLMRPHPGVGPQIATEGVHRILEELKVEQSTPALSWWGRFKAWIRSLLDRQQEQKAWDLPFHLSQRILAIISYSLLAATVIALLVIVLNELRIAGVFSRLGIAPPTRSGRRSAPAPARPLTAEDVSRAPLREQASFVLRLIVEGLARAQRLTDRRSLTHRELERAARLDTPEDISVFRALLRAAEATLYGDRPPPDDELVAIVRDSMALARRVIDQAPAGA